MLLSGLQVASFRWTDKPKTDESQLRQSRISIAGREPLKSLEPSRFIARPLPVWVPSNISADGEQEPEPGSRAHHMENTKFLLQLLFGRGPVSRNEIVLHPENDHPVKLLTLADVSVQKVQARRDDLVGPNR